MTWPCPTCFINRADLRRILACTTVAAGGVSSYFRRIAHVYQLLSQHERDRARLCRRDLRPRRLRLRELRRPKPPLRARPALGGARGGPGRRAEGGRRAESGRAEG